MGERPILGDGLVKLDLGHDRVSMLQDRILIVDEDGFGSDRDAGLDAVGRLMDDGVAVAIKYAVVLDDPGRDPYLEGLLRCVDRQRVVSGMGERPAIVHMRDFKLPGMTTGSGCIAPRSCSAMFQACSAGDWQLAGWLREAVA